MESVEQVINWIFGGQVDATKIVTILVAIWAVVKSVMEWRAKKKLLTMDASENETQRQLKEAKAEIGEMKKCVSMLSDALLTAYLSSNTIPPETKKQLGHIGAELNKVAGIDLKDATGKLIDAATAIAPDLSLGEKREEIDAAVEITETAIDAANEVAQSAIDKLKV